MNLYFVQFLAFAYTVFMIEIGGTTIEFIVYAGIMFVYNNCSTVSKLNVSKADSQFDFMFLLKKILVSYIYSKKLNITSSLSSLIFKKYYNDA